MALRQTRAAPTCLCSPLLLPLAPHLPRPPPHAPPASQFTHATRFLGKKVVLLGLYNGQRLEGEAAGDVVTYSRALGEGTRESTFVRLLLLRGRLQGAVLIGDTGLEEAAENLILDALDVGGYGPALLDPSLELDHVFD